MRRDDWQQRFSDYLRERRDMAFDWGSHDCCTFAAGAVEAVTGRNPMADVPPYSNEFDAVRMVHEGGGMEALATSILGESVSPMFATVGDVVLLTNEDRELLGVCNGVNAIAASKDGTAALEMSAAIAAWKV